MRTFIDDLLEGDEENIEIIKTFKPQKTLCSQIFLNKEKIRNSVRKELMNIVNNFIDFSDTIFFIYDIQLTGSIANYNWSMYSDIDLHVLVDFEEIELYNELTKTELNDLKKEWNLTHNLKVGDFDVELYFQDMNEEHVSSGIYSILNDEWIKLPIKSKKSIDEKLILKKSNEFIKNIDSLIGNPDKDQITDLMLKIKKFRKSGLESGGELSYENLVFKLLRRNGYIKKLVSLI